MSISTKILISFSTIMLIIVGWNVKTYVVVHDLLAQITEVQEIEYELELRSERVIAYDAILEAQLGIAILEAENGNFKNTGNYLQKCMDTSEMLNETLTKDVRILLQKSLRSEEDKNQTDIYLSNLAGTHGTLDRLGFQVFEALKNEDTVRAREMATGKEFQQTKADQYKNSRAWADLEHKVTTENQQSIKNTIRVLMNTMLLISIVLATIVMITLVLLKSFIKSFETEDSQH